MAALAIHLGQFGLFVVAGLCIGVLGGVGQFYRFAAIEAVAPASKGLAVSLTLTGGVLAAFLGPWLARSTRDMLGTPFLASFLVLAGVALWRPWPAGACDCRLRSACGAAGPAGEADPGRPRCGLAVAGRWPTAS
jgi:hypothetical protein